MPAIDIARLKTQTARLCEHFGQPEVFLHDLHEVLDFYTNRTMRSSQVVRRLSLSTYHTPVPVMQQIERELIPLANAQTAEGVKLVYALWHTSSLETRLLAARLLGMIPPAQAMPAFTRLPDWLAESTDKAVRQTLLVDAFTRLRRENPEAFFILLEDWLKSPRTVLQVWGLQALIPLLQDPHFENLPAVFRILRPAIQAVGPATQLDFQACLATLENVSLTETAAFLREVIRDKPKPMMLRIFRRILPGLSQGLQEALREILREQDNQASKP
jgi:hypothetical protein